MMISEAEECPFHSAFRFIDRDLYYILHACKAGKELGIKGIRRWIRTKGKERNNV